MWGTVDAGRKLCGRPFWLVCLECSGCQMAVLLGDPQMSVSVGLFCAPPREGCFSCLLVGLAVGFWSWIGEGAGFPGWEYRFSLNPLFFAPNPHICLPLHQISPNQEPFTFIFIDFQCLTRMCEGELYDFAEREWGQGPGGLIAP